VLPKPLDSPACLERLNRTADTVNVKKSLGYVYDALRLTRHALGGRVPLLGFTGAPWTLMAYMVTGGGAKSYTKAKSWFYKWPKAAHTLLKLIADTSVAYLVEQVRANSLFCCFFLLFCRVQLLLLQHKRSSRLSQQQHTLGNAMNIGACRCTNARGV
jgi:uroporphyrinogen-III decarboxylase